MKVALIVLNYNDAETTLNFIDSVVGYNSIDYIIIVDNKSSDDSYQQLCQKKNDKIDIIQCSKNLGYSVGNNYGIKYAEDKYNPDYVIISNPDVYFEEKIINEIISILNDKNEYAMGTGTMIETTKTRNLKAYKIGGYTHHLLSTFPLIGRLYNNSLVKYSDKIFLKDVSEVEVVPGSFFIAKMNCFKKIGYFSEQTFLYCEEEILAYKLKSAGYKSIILNNLVFNHNHSVSINKSISSNLIKHKILQQSRRIFLKECLEVSSFKLALFDFITKISLKEREVLYYLREKVK